jgi:hypothetical protein
LFKAEEEEEEGLVCFVLEEGEGCLFFGFECCYFLGEGGVEEAVVDVTGGRGGGKEGRRVREAFCCFSGAATSWAREGWRRQ